MEMIYLFIFLSDKSAGISVFESSFLPHKHISLICIHRFRSLYLSRNQFAIIVLLKYSFWCFYRQVFRVDSWLRNCYISASIRYNKGRWTQVYYSDLCLRMIVSTWMIYLFYNCKIKDLSCFQLLLILLLAFQLSLCSPAWPECTNTNCLCVHICYRRH